MCQCKLHFWWHRAQVFIKYSFRCMIHSVHGCNMHLVFHMMNQSINTYKSTKASLILTSFGLCYGNSSSLPWWRGCTKLRLTSWDHRGRRGGWHRKHLSRRGCPIVVVVVTWSHQIGGWRREGDITIVMECSIHRYVRWCIYGDRS